MPTIWLVPIIYLVSKTVFHWLACGGRGVRIVPKWPSAPFWPFIFKSSEVKREFLKEVLEFKSGRIFLFKAKDLLVYLELKVSRVKYWL